MDTTYEIRVEKYNFQNKFVAGAFNIKNAPAGKLRILQTTTADGATAAEAAENLEVKIAEILV